MIKKVHKVTVLIVDHDGLGADAIKDEIENTSYANHCMSPQVMCVETEEVEWRDDHPLNYLDKAYGAYIKLFNKRWGE